MAIYLEMPKLIHEFPFRTLSNEGEVLTTPHWHKEIEILLITEGVVNLFINDKPMQLKRRDSDNKRRRYSLYTAITGK